MHGTIQIRGSVEQKIRSAFRHVTLGAGMSLRRAQLVDGQSALRENTPSRSLTFGGGNRLADESGTIARAVSKAR
jgi:hypothetical protein